MRPLVDQLANRQLDAYTIGKWMLLRKTIRAEHGERIGVGSAFALSDGRNLAMPLARIWET